MTLWNLLNAICFFIPVAGAISESRDAKTGLSGYALAIAVGVVLGMGCTWIMWSVGERIGASVKPYSHSRQERHLRILYVGAVVWLLAVAFLSRFVLLAVMHRF
jgi:hypothetical protein